MVSSFSPRAVVGLGRTCRGVVRRSRNLEHVVGPDDEQVGGRGARRASKASRARIAGSPATVISGGERPGAEAARLFEAGTLTIPVANAFDLHRADEAHAASEQGHVAGRTIIVVA